MICDRCENRNKRNICKICHDGDCYEGITLTNADRIKSMDIKELTKFISSVICNTRYDCGYPACPSMEGNYCNGIKEHINKDILEWLGK